MSEKIHNWEKAVVTLLNLDGWNLTHTGKGNESWDATGTTPKGQECVIEMKFRNKYYDTKILEKFKHDKLIETGKVALYLVNDPKGNYMFWLNNLEGLKTKDIYCPDTTLWTKKKVLKPCYLLEEKDAAIINLNEDLQYQPQKINKTDSKFKINIDRKNYTKIFNKFKTKIKKGETYQIKICTKYRNKSKIDPLDYFCRLTKTNLAPEAFLIKDKEYSIISCSPETLIIKKGNSISTKPIAGTLKKNPQLNKYKALNYFRKNIKETKEHNMIVDMERNDLSRICLPGTVKINKEKIVEEYKDLYHYVSLINGKLKKNVQTIDIIKSMMPGGSVIGCPKINTLNLLNHQEKEERNIYTGSFGYIMFNGDMKFNIIIRSILYYKNVSEISVASGVVIDSNAKNEFNENFIKAKALIDLYK